MRAVALSILIVGFVIDAAIRNDEISDGAKKVIGALLSLDLALIILGL